MPVPAPDDEEEAEKMDLVPNLLKTPAESDSSERRRFRLSLPSFGSPVQQGIEMEAIPFDPTTVFSGEFQDERLAHAFVQIPVGGHRRCRVVLGPRLWRQQAIQPDRVAGDHVAGNPGLHVYEPG